MHLSNPKVELRTKYGLQPAWPCRAGPGEGLIPERGLEGGFIADGLWHHITFVVDGMGGRLHVDGQLRSTKPWTGGPGVATTAQPLELGRYRGRYFHGEIDDLAIWTAPPYAGQILSLINRPS